MDAAEIPAKFNVSTWAQSAGSDRLPDVALPVFQTLLLSDGGAVDYPEYSISIKLDDGDTRTVSYICLAWCDPDPSTLKPGSTVEVAGEVVGMKIERLTKINVALHVLLVLRRDAERLSKAPRHVGADYATFANESVDGLLRDCEALGEG